MLVPILLPIGRYHPYGNYYKRIWLAHVEGRERLSGAAVGVAEVDVSALDVGMCGEELSLRLHGMLSLAGHAGVSLTA